MKALNYRMELPDKDKQYYLNLQKGFEGEVLFDEYLQRIEIESFILNDLLFELNHSHFQIDSLLISQDHLHLFEVKNYEGEFYFEGEKFKKINGVEIKNPMLQLDRNDSLFRQLMHSFHLKVPIRAYLIFINPEFTLYQAPLDRRIILPTNLNRLIQQFDTQKSTLNNQHARLSEKLLSNHLTKSPFSKVPEYDYNELRKGVFCESCGTVMKEYRPVIVTCQKCGKHENTKDALLRSIEEYKILNPTKKISTNTIYEWCGGLFPKKIINLILKGNFIVSGYGQWSYYQ
ncbi:nuclease-related domain-containing protein [Heyndrickxia sp. MSNUG]|uniref:nuclease-related domain-containing protein n=1 Tax=Heyndrickxia sp. MSNUG TaxID=3136677 RepID=UPI003C2E96C9